MSATAGLGFKPEHFVDARTCDASGLWFEVHADNYMVDGGPRLAMLADLRHSHPLSLHGVGLSLASASAPSPSHLRRLRILVERYEPFVVSEHLAWCAWRGIYNPALLPFPRSREALRRIVRNISITQDVLKKQILVENAAQYIALPEHEFSEAEFVA